MLFFNFIVENFFKVLSFFRHVGRLQIGIRINAFLFSTMCPVKNIHCTKSHISLVPEYHGKLKNTK